MRWRWFCREREGVADLHRPRKVGATGDPAESADIPKVASSGVVQTGKEAQRAEEARQRTIALHAENAKGWWESGRTYYIVHLTLGGTVAQLTNHTVLEGDDVSGVIQQVEAVGWRLHDIGYVYQPLRERSHAMTTSNIMTGNIVGIYTFRRPEPPPPLPG
jgi:hypothetical protein